MKIQLHDFIGNHSGMHLYLNSFRDLFSAYNIETSVHSNYKDLKTNKSYPNIFKGSILKKIILLLICYLLFFYNCLKINKGEYIIISIYGTKIDVVFLAISCLFKTKVILDIHEVVIMEKSNFFTSKVFRFFYSRCNNKVISHSIKTDKSLIVMGFDNEVIKIPHVHYSFPKDYNISNISKNVKLSILENNKNFLFFGNIVSSKGIIDLLSTIEIAVNKKDDFTIIIAGKDSSKIIQNYKNLHLLSSKIKLITRHINDDEMKYLFENSDYVLLPYRDIYQSGVLEMAITYKKPILTSNINYFKNLLFEYPSFGKAINTKNHNLFYSELLRITNSKIQETFYTDKDMFNYFRSDSFDDFIKKLKRL